ncbi:hypothetical protein PR048_030362 [Dryococelus australis]|uniref:HTH CENPB-type domain-containing protein n=1 Tax=Dryococelus australis TaxID=614101 RepID=A0ABQ9G8S7_9NEOP|nr:hypothetical protein PR048_030362 [Dryococelus australis]
METNLLQWYHEIRAANIPISGPLIQQKVQYLALRLGVPGFKLTMISCSGLKNITTLLQKLCGELAAINIDKTHD